MPEQSYVAAQQAVTKKHSEKAVVEALRRALPLRNVKVSCLAYAHVCATALV